MLQNILRPNLAVRPSPFRSSIPQLLRFLSSSTSKLNKPKKKTVPFESNILKYTPMLIPTTSVAQSLIRCFSTSKSALAFYRPPKDYIIGGGPLSKLWARIPDSIKLFGTVALTGYLFLFVALPILVIVVPPVVIGGWLFVKGSRALRARQTRKRWELIADSTLVFNPKNARNPLLIPPPDQINSELANFEINRIVDAFWSNENGIADYFKTTKINDLALGTLDGVEYTYNSNSSVFADSSFIMMVIQQRTMYDKSTSKEIANVIMSLKCLEKPLYDNIVDPTANIGKSQVLIEIVPKALSGPSFIIKTPSSVNDNYNDDEFIDIKGKTTTL